MRYTNNMLFAHPVLSEVGDDFSGAEFNAEFGVDIDEQKLRITSEISVNCPEILDLINESKVGIGYYLMCKDTFLTRLREVKIGEAVEDFTISNFYGGVEIRPVIWTKAEIVDWPCSTLHPEYGGAVTLPLAALLAVGEIYRFTVDREFLKPLESVFELASDDEIQQGEFRVQLDYEKIRIEAHSSTIQNVGEYRNVPNGRLILLNSVYLPAVMEVLSRISTGDLQEYDSKSWHRVFVARCQQLNITIENCDSPFRDAQKLLKLPFKGLEAKREEFFA